MTNDEAITVMIDVATKRKPHSRNAIKEATAVLEPPAGPGEIDPSDEVHRAEAAAAAQVLADARLARAKVDLAAATERVNDAAAKAAAVGASPPAPEASPVIEE